MQGLTPKYGNIKGYEYLVQHLQRLRFAMSGGMGGQTPLTFSEIYAYNESTHADLSPDEVLLLAEMSEEYCRYINDRNPATQSPPYED